MRCAAALALVAAACRYSSDLPDGLVVTCARDEVCPAGYACQVTLGRCVARAAFDSTPPELGHVTVTYLPGRDNVVTSPVALAADSQARITFSTSEALRVLPSLTTSLDCDDVLGTEVAFETYCRVPGGGTPAEVDEPVRVRLEDLASNVANLELASVTVDTLPPPAPDTQSLGGVVYRREPWGSDESQGVPRFTLRGRRAAAGATLVLARSGSLELGRVPVDSDGGFSGALQPVDVSALEVAAVDTAGNVSSYAFVHDIEWVATAVNKRANSQIDNPHRVQAVRAFGPALNRSDAIERGAIDGIDRVGGGRLLVEGGASWRQLGFEPPLPLDEPPVFAADEARGRIVGFGGLLGTVLPELVYEWNGSRWSISYPADPEGDSHPTGRLAPSLAWDESRQRVVLFGGGLARGDTSDEMWEWTGRSWVALPRGPAALMYAALWHDRRRGRLVITGGTGPARALSSDTWLQSGTGWERLDGGGPPPRLAPAYAWDDETGAGYLGGGAWLDGGFATDMWRFDGVSWSQLAVAMPSGPVPPYGFTWDRARNVGVLADVGHLDGGLPDRRLFEFDGTAWTSRDLPDGGVPSPLYVQGVFYDPTRAQTIFYGLALAPFPSTQTFSDDGQRFDRRNSSALIDSLLPSTEMVCLPGAACLTVGSGVGRFGSLFDTFALTEFGWVPLGRPPPIASMADFAALAYDANRASLVFVTGPTDAGALSAYALGTDGGWAALARPPVPSLSAFGGMASSGAGPVLCTSFGVSVQLEQDGVWRTGPTMPANAGAPMLGSFADGGVFASTVRSLADGGASNTVMIVKGGRFEPIAELPLAVGRAGAWDTIRQHLVLTGGFDFGVGGAERTYDVRLDGGVEELAAADPEDDGNPVPRYTKAFAWDPSFDVIRMGGGLVDRLTFASVGDLWLLESARNRPAVIARVALEAAHAPPGAKWTSLDLRVVAGGQAELAGAPMQGYALMVREAGRWVQKAVSGGTLGAMADLHPHVVGERDLDLLLSGRPELSIAVVPLGTNGAENAKVALDYFQIDLAWRQ